VSERIPAIITARGGSRRYPGKNVLPFCGHPLVAWSIIQADASERCTDIFVSTDDDLIAAISETYGAEIIWRPGWTDADELTVGIPVLHAMKEIRKKFEYSRAFTMLPTSPLRYPWDMDNMVAKADDIIRRKGTDKINVNSQATMPECCIVRKLDDIQHAPFTHNKYAQFLNQGGGLNLPNIEIYEQITNANPRTDKEIDAKVADNAIYITGQIGENGRRHEHWDYYFELKQFQAFDIDNEEQFTFVEALMKAFILGEKGRRVYDEYKMAKLKQRATRTQGVVRDKVT